MTTWRVQDVMTTEVITAPEDASIAEIVTLLNDRQITAVPLTDKFDVVLGVVSWTDLRDKIDVGAPEDSRTGWWARSAPLSSAQWPEGTAAAVMSAPALTIGADTSLSAAARVMYRRGVGRLLVVDRDNRLHGIVTRSDLLKVYSRLDAVIRDEVVQRVLLDTLRIQPGAVQATVEEGVVTLTGRTERRTTAVAAARLTAAVPGVTDVVNQLAFDVDDTLATAPAPRPAERDPLRGWWTGRRPFRSGEGTAKDRIAGHDRRILAGSAGSS
ncbi:CBS domain-containing protein [Jidongwangia harbinensis]|uniref:CBS domain-containing protein n=1 Tax=Jidongwangia harbinensis TaxID=2878561 RepID=UPI001CD98BC9|nr:CBS domain-containing protein [Jidongwangia harbinensis]MCA2218854.1 CBS domain-containing protein [Jidongwangia harbinensis]